MPQFAFTQRHDFDSTNSVQSTRNKGGKKIDSDAFMGSTAGHQASGIDNPNYYRLWRVLSTFTYYDPTIGYMQGMNFIVATLMYHCNEEEAFWLFTQLMQHKEDVRSVYTPPQMPGLILHVRVLERLIQLKLPKIHKFMTRKLSLSSH